MVRGMKSDKELYRQLRGLDCGVLCEREIPAFERASARERVQRVALIRAVGVVLSAQGSVEQRKGVRVWLRKLLKDPEEKVRRYALAALPKIGVGLGEEGDVLELLKQSSGERESKSIGRVLGKIGGEATLAAGVELPAGTEQKVKASLARKVKPGAIRMDAPLQKFSGARIVLRCRTGLEAILRDEVKEFIGKNRLFRITGIHPGIVLLAGTGPFSLGALFSLRCFATVGFDVGRLPGNGPGDVEALARAIASEGAREIFTAFTDGPPRYRLDFIGKGHQRGNVAQVIQRAYALRPEILNDAREATWAVDVHPLPKGSSVEIRPKFAPDPRLGYRQDDVAAASHPPLAAAMARLAGRQANEVVWDPFCGSGLELAECLLLGGVDKVFGTDTSAEALAIAQANISAVLEGKDRPAGHEVEVALACCDFREHGLAEGSVSLMITNPPMGRRIRVPNLRGMFVDLFAVAARVLRPGGRLVFPNPVKLVPQDKSLKLTHQKVVDLGGFDCRLEVWEKQAGLGQ